MSDRMLDYQGPPQKQPTRCGDGRRRIPLSFWLAIAQIFWFFPATIAVGLPRMGAEKDFLIDTGCSLLTALPALASLFAANHAWEQPQRTGFRNAGLWIAGWSLLLIFLIWIFDVGLHPKGQWDAL